MKDIFKIRFLRKYGLSILSKFKNKNIKDWMYLCYFKQKVGLIKWSLIFHRMHAFEHKECIDPFHVMSPKQAGGTCSMSMIDTCHAAS